MKRFLIAIALLGLFTSCDDGDIIVTDFDFEDSTLQFCEGPNKYVIYATNNDDVNESISVEFTNSNITTDDSGNFITNTSENITFSLSTTNKVIYRIYDGQINGNSYFCQVVPPSDPVPTTEYVSGSDGTVTIATRFTDETGDADPDDDDLSNLQEGWDPDGINHQDTDGDGIPDYLDRDDDGDNVITRVELLVNEDSILDDNGEVDTDEDGIPNYLDDDDDGDGVETRLEVSEEDGLTNPGSFSSTGDGLPNYLNDQQTEFFQHNENISHNITRNYGYQVTLRNFNLERKDDGSGETIGFSSYQLGSLNETNIPFELCPNDLDCSEEEEDENTDETEDTDEETSN
ncbi:hypothetical protein [Christiangramia portivictoriae]|uniref:hypothetical protein n=1 Tax=Christiangramia portivictoriae TaxID=326069 RepID=UPI000408824C|nr:hypothetical protein [Christiangramia portivictoriae]